jgi:ABC-type transport system substrate-binding protein
VEPSVSPAQLFTDREYGATYPGVRVRRHQSNLAGLVTFHGARAPVPGNRFVGSNYSRYLNPDLDALIDGFFTTIPTRERMQLLGDAIYHITEQVVMFPLFYNTEFTLVANRVANVEARKAATGAAQAWNSHQWELK